MQKSGVEIVVKLIKFALLQGSRLRFLEQFLVLMVLNHLVNPPPEILNLVDIERAKAHEATYVLLFHPIGRSEEHTSELQSRQYLVCRLLLEKKKKIIR